MQLFALGISFVTLDTKEDPKKPRHATARFLHDYFVDEPGAIAQVCDVSMSHILRIPASERNYILYSRPLKPAPLPDPIIEAFGWDQQFDPSSGLDSGRVSIEPGDLWPSSSDTPVSPPYVSPFELDDSIAASATGDDTPRSCQSLEVTPPPVALLDDDPRPAKKS